MAKKFVRNITNTKLEGANKEPLFTNIQNDILSDNENVYIRNKNEYFPLTKSILDIKSPNQSIKIRKTKNTVYIDTTQSEEIKDLNKPKLIKVTRPLKKSETDKEITLSLDPIISEKIHNIKDPKIIEVLEPLTKTETDTDITLSLDPATKEKIENFKTPKKIEASSPLNITENEKVIKITIDDLFSQIETKGAIKKEKTNAGISLEVEPVSGGKVIKAVEPLKTKETDTDITLSIDPNVFEVGDNNNRFIAKSFTDVLENILQKEKMEDKSSDWQKIPPGYYYVRKNEIENQPSSWGFMRVVYHSYVYTVIWEQVTDGLLYRKSGDNKKTTEWKQISYKQKDPVSEKNINVVAPLKKEETDTEITLSIEEVGKHQEKEFKVQAPLELAEDETRRIVTLNEKFKNKALEKNTFSYPLVNDNGKVGLDSNYTSKILSNNLKVNTPLSMSKNGNTVTISIDNLESLIKSEIEKYNKANATVTKEDFAKLENRLKGLEIAMNSLSNTVDTILDSM